MTYRLLDLFCGAGGCSVGYARAGFDVVGVDIEPHADYPFELHVMDWEASRPMWDGFDVIHASPPCPRYSSATPNHARDKHPDLVGPVRRALIEWGGTYVIENVPRAPLVDPIRLCGKGLGLPHFRRHRLFESNVALMAAPCACDRRPTYDVSGDHGYKNGNLWQGKDGAKRWGKARDVDHAQQIMGIDWMTRWGDLADAIPPVYTEHIGHQLIDYLEAVAA